MRGLLIPVGGLVPQAPAMLAPGAMVIGDVRFGARCSVWFNAVLRGDINRVELGDDCNVQDLACLHVTRRLPCVLGRCVSIAHGAIVHGCSIGDGCLVGMGAKVLDGARLGRGCLVAAGCVVPEGLEVPDGHLVAGVPGKVVKPLPPALAERIARVAGDYVAYQQLYPAIMEATAACAAAS